MPLIKRYSNRKLYDTQAKTYITLQDVERMIREGQDVRVVDHTSGEDLTALIQAQIILELERKLKGGLPRTVLTDLIQRGSQTLNHLKEALTPPDWKSRVDAEIEQRVRLLILEGQVTEEEGLRWLRQLTQVETPNPIPDWPTDAELQRALQEHGIPTRADIEQLSIQVQTLTDELESLRPRRRVRPKPTRQLPARAKRP